MTNRFKKFATSAVWGALMAVTPAVAAEKPMEPKQIAQLAKDAKTSSEHTEVA